MPRDDLSTDLLRATEGLYTARHSLDRAQKRLRAREEALGLGSHWSDAELAWVVNQWSSVRHWATSARELPTPRDIGIMQDAARDEEDRTEFEVAALKLLRDEGITKVASLARLGALLTAVDLLNPVCRCGEYEDECNC